jgi:NADH-quinone oxidoreductase subunit F
MAERPELVFAGTDGGAVTEIDEYIARGGFAALAKARNMEPDEVIAAVEASGLRGRGGAFFPTGRKWAFVPKPEALPKPHYLVVNADESEPGTFKDREIMLRVPFRFLEGCLIAAHAISAQHVFVYIRGEYEREFEVLRSALEQMHAHGDLLGDATVVLHRGAGAYICGEETALLESLEGKRGQPRTKPPFPAVAGLYAAPTAVNNVESIATVTCVFEVGPEEYAKIGVPGSTGTRVFSLSGNVVNPGNYELPHGITLRELVYDIGGGIPNGRSLKAIIPGGSSTPILTADDIDTPLDFDSLVAAGSSIGSAGVVVIDDRCCMVQLGIRVSQFYEHESCGKCTPCRAGGSRPPPLRLRPHPREVSLSARGLRRDRGRELRLSLPGRVPGAHRPRALSVRGRVLARGDPRPVSHAPPGAARGGSGRMRRCRRRPGRDS